MAKQDIIINIFDNSVLTHIALYEILNNNKNINIDKQISNGSYNNNLDKFLNLHHTILVSTNSVKESIKSIILNLLHSNSKYKVKYVFHNDEYDSILSNFAETFYHCIELDNDYLNNNVNNTNIVI